MKYMNIKISIILVLTVCFLGFALIGCTSTCSTITEYDSAGNITRCTESSESVIKTVMESTANKTVVIWEDGWSGYISMSAGTAEDPTPHGKIYAGKINRGWLSILPNQQGVSNIERIVQATKSDISVTLEGINAASSKIQESEKAAVVSAQTE